MAGVFHVFFLFYQGVVSVTYKLPPFPTKGKWTIRVEAMTQTYDQQFFVERYYLTFFEAICSDNLSTR